LRTRHYVPRRLILLLTPVLRYSYSRDAYVLRGVGRSVGPVLRAERRRGRARLRPSDRVERRRPSIA